MNNTHTRIYRNADAEQLDEQIEMLLNGRPDHDTEGYELEDGYFIQSRSIHSDEPAILVYIRKLSDSILVHIGLGSWTDGTSIVNRIFPAFNTSVESSAITSLFRFTDALNAA